ncbi:hypothetical protein ACIPEQ_10465 [Curtobacterium sp. NPDC087080]|uniref:hypothetical protein n=1 Tax=Curtobacterium sp. NPDC087080 TaxID=3363965 RepID=UPI003812AEA9
MRQEPQLSVNRAQFTSSERFDRLVAVVGYEERASTAYRSLTNSVRDVTAFDYQNSGILSYDSNRDIFASAWSTSNPIELMHQLQSDYTNDRNKATVAPSAVMAGGVRWLIDISCMDRDILGSIVRFAADNFKDTDVLRFVYSPAAFSEDMQGDVDNPRVNRPVQGLEGWPADPSQELHAIVGLGFERTLALAAVETLEPGKALYFHPQGFDRRYDAEFEMINRGLFISEFDSMRSYSLSEPLSLYRMLENYTSALAHRVRIVFVPLGPKVFALASMLVAVQYPSTCSVWRVSPGPERRPTQRRALGPLIAVDVRVGVPDN